MKHNSEKTSAVSAPFKAVILAGGSGERFWPLSTPHLPKQFLRIFGGESLLRQSVLRLGKLVAPENVYIITAQSLMALTRRELPEIPAANVIGEPMRRDTGAAIALATGLCGSGVMGVFSSDQLVTDAPAFRRTVQRAIRQAQRAEMIVTLGIRPSYPATAFGYVNPEKGTFVEKPSLALARRYLRQGYLWNAGIFIGRTEVFRNAFSRHAPELMPLTVRPPRTPRGLRKVYGPLAKISFDYAVMEKLGAVAVEAGDFGWDDVGGFSAFDKHFPHDERGNVRCGPSAVAAVDANDNICVAQGAHIALLGVRNLVVVTTRDHVLVVDKSRVGELKKLFQAGLNTNTKK